MYKRQLLIAKKTNTTTGEAVVMRLANKVLVICSLVTVVLVFFAVCLIAPTDAMTWTNPQPISPPTYTFSSRDVLKGIYGVPTVTIPKTATNPYGDFWMEWFCNYSVSSSLTWVKYSVYDVATNIMVGDSGTEGYANAGTTGIDLISPILSHVLTDSQKSQMGSQGYKIYFLTTNVDDWVLYVSPYVSSTTASPSPTSTATATPSPTPTPTATPTPTPTLAPTTAPTQAPITTASPTPTHTPTPTQDPTATPYSSQNPTPTPTVPEFPSWIILPIFIASLLSIVFIKRKIAKK